MTDTNDSSEEHAVQEHFYFIELRTKYNGSLYFTTADTILRIEGIAYQPGAELRDLYAESLGSKAQDMSVTLHSGLQYLDLLETEVDIMQKSLDEHSNLCFVYSGQVARCTHRRDGAIDIHIVSRFRLLERRVGIFFSAFCRASLGDKKCKVPLAEYSFEGEIIDCLTDRMFRGSHLVQGDGFFSNGMIKFLTGQNANTETRIVTESKCLVCLLRAPGRTMSLGDRYVIIAGCDKTITSCSQRFNNAVNFRGEPFIEV